MVAGTDEEHEPGTAKNGIPDMEIRLFGPMDVRIGGEPMGRLRSRKGQWLLALLALRAGSDVPRSFLAGMLWPESTESQSLASLRQSLADLRAALGPQGWRIASPSQNALRLELDGISLDVLTFDRDIVGDTSDGVESALDLYRGPLLEGCTEEWVFLERDRREQAYLAALERLAARDSEAGQHARAADLLRRVVGVDPYRENAHRALLSALAGAGDYGAAILHYRELRLRLRQELNADPSPETVALMDRLRHDARQRMISAPVAVVTMPAAAEHSQGSALASEMAEGIAPVPYCVPRPLSELIGRRIDVSDIRTSLQRARLVTVLGPGGVGKTRLSIQVAEESRGEFRDGTYFVDLSALSNGTHDGVAQAAAALMEIAEEAHRSLTDSIAAAIGMRRVLLIFDNCEHVIEDSATLVRDLLTRCSRLSVLATSRQPLGLVGEVVRPLSPLDSPADSAALEPEAALAYDAVRLFVERAIATSPVFRLTPANAPVVAEICRRLDGIPFALELAAARIRLLTPEQIAARLDDRFRLLAGGSRVALPRQQTLRALIDWSYDILSPEEQRFLRHLSVFAGSWTLDEAEAMYDEDAPADALDTLALLVEKSLVIAEDSGVERRYRMMESVREYAREKLEGAGEQNAAQTRHLLCMLAIAEEADRGMRGPQQIEWLRRIDRESDNLRAALDFCEASEGLAVEHMRLAAAVWRYWMLRGHLSEARDRLASALARECPECDASLRTQVLNGAAGIAWNLGDLTLASKLMDESLALSRELGDQIAISQALNNLGNISYSMGRHLEARRLYEEALEIRQVTGNRQLTAASVNNLGIATHALGDLDASLAYHEQGLALCTDLGDLQGINSALIGIGNIAKERGDYGTAERYMRQALEKTREVGDREGIAGCLSNLGFIAYRRGDLVNARVYSAESLRASREIGDRRGMAEALDNLAMLETAEGRPERAARLLGAVDALRALLVAPRSAWDQRVVEEDLARLQNLLGEAELESLRAEGANVCAEDAADVALAHP